MARDIADLDKLACIGYSAMCNRTNIGTEQQVRPLGIKGMFFPLRPVIAVVQP
ncbi:MAG: hypothetical protein M1305_03100 [Candidatus Marsarchaeota archaeon]|nr:hypothetical protein [Candidatus Marsarchaeota archaeon]